MDAPVSRRRYPRTERRSEILRVATRVFHARGYEAASLQDIAEELGIAKASLYYYFASKQALLHAVLTEIIGIGMVSVRSIQSLGGDPLTRLWRLLDGHIHHLCRYPTESALFLHERKRIPLDRRRDILADDYAYQAVFIETILEGQSRRQIRAELDPKMAALSILGSANYIYTWFQPNGVLKPDAIGVQFAAMTINSLATDVALKDWRRPLPHTKGQRKPL